MCVEHFDDLSLIDMCAHEMGPWIFARHDDTHTHTHTHSPFAHHDDTHTHTHSPFAPLDENTSRTGANLGGDNDDLPALKQDGGDMTLVNQVVHPDCRPVLEFDMVRKMSWTVQLQQFSIACDELIHMEHFNQKYFLLKFVVIVS